MLVAASSVHQDLSVIHISQNRAFVARGENFAIRMTINAHRGSDTR